MPMDDETLRTLPASPFYSASYHVSSTNLLYPSPTDEATINRLLIRFNFTHQATFLATCSHAKPPRRRFSTIFTSSRKSQPHMVTHSFRPISILKHCVGNGNGNVCVLRPVNMLMSFWDGDNEDEMMWKCTNGLGSGGVRTHVHAIHGRTA